MNVHDAPPETPEAGLSALRDHPEWSEADRDAWLDRLVERFPTDDLIRAVGDRLHDLSGADAETLLRIVEAFPRPALLKALASALVAQPDLVPERAWEALAVLDGAGVLDENPGLAERWAELNEDLDEEGSIEELVAQIEGDPEGIWLALQGLNAVEPEVRPEIVAGLARVPLGPGLIEFLRLLAYSHDEPTRRAALDALSTDPGKTPTLHDAWSDLAAHHPLDAVKSEARRKIGAEVFGVVSRPTPVLVRSLVTPMDGQGHGRIVLSATQGGRRATSAFLCDIDRGLLDIAGGIEPEDPEADSAFEEIVTHIAGEVVEGKERLALGLLAGSLFLSGAEAPPSWRFWIEATAGQIVPAPFWTEGDANEAASVTAIESAAWTSRVLDACTDWFDRSPLTYELAEEILLREKDAGPDPKRDAGAYRFLFEHRLQGVLETYRRMLLWMAGFWRGAGESALAGAAVGLAAQLSDIPNVVPGHPFTVALTTRSLARAQEDLRRGVDPRQKARR